MFCRIALILLLTSCIIYPAETVEAITEGSVYLWHWFDAFSDALDQELN
jgi:hypothetical protein